MPTLTSPPSPSRFATVWSRAFSKALDRAAGRDGRLSLSELRTMARRTDGDQFYADDAQKLFERTGQQTVAASKLKAMAFDYARDAARVVAGADARISYNEAAMLPSTLVEDFFVLRGRPTPNAPSSDVESLRRALEPQLAEMLMPSSTDAGFAFVSAPAPIPAGQITESQVRQLLSVQHDALISTLISVDPSLAKLSNKRNVEVQDGEQWLSSYATPQSSDPNAIASAAKFAALRRALMSNLTDLTVLRFGDGELSTFIVGRTRDGHLAGLITAEEV